MFELPDKSSLPWLVQQGNLARQVALGEDKGTIMAQVDPVERHRVTLNVRIRDT